MKAARAVRRRLHPPAWPEMLEVRGEKGRRNRLERLKEAESSGLGE